MNNIKIVLAFAAVLSVYPGPAPAEDSPTENEQLRLEVETLKQRVHELEANRPPANCEEAKPKKHGKGWDALEVGMSKDEVTAIVGKPGRVDKWKTGEAWYYGKGGEVDFGVEGRTTGWLKP